MAIGILGDAVPAVYSASVEPRGLLRTWSRIFGAARALSKLAGEVPVHPPTPPRMSAAALKQAIGESKSVRDMIRADGKIELRPVPPKDVP